MAMASARTWVSKHKLWKKKPKFSTEKSSFPNNFGEILLEIKKSEMALSISRHKGILKKHLCKSFS